MSRVIVGATWDDAPHLSEAAKKELWDSIPLFQRDARAKGIPQLGAGAIYPFPESDIRVADFEIPKHWPRSFGLDCALGGTTAAVWSAWDRDADIVYIYSVYRRAQAETAIHADAIKARGLWIPGVGDAADIIDADRTQFLTVYRRHGVDLILAVKGVESGIQKVYDRLSGGRLKVFASCTAWFEEFRMYHRDEHGRVVKKHDHVMDATRYDIVNGLSRAKVEPAPKRLEDPAMRIIDGAVGAQSMLGWMK